jgi:hypothetical protein
MILWAVIMLPIIRINHLHNSMKYIFWLFLFISVRVSAQYDTSLITRSINYLKTDQFKSEFRVFATEAIKKEVLSWPDKKTVRRYKSQQENRMNFWLHHNCYASDSNYFTPNISTQVMLIEGVIGFTHYDTIAWKTSFNCREPVLIEAFFISPGIIELRNFQGTRSKGVWFGESQFIRLEWTADKPKIIWWSYMIHN